MQSLIYNIGELATFDPKSGSIQKYNHAAMEIVNRKVAQIFSGEDTPDYRNYDVAVDAGGKLVTPGFVDAHTHPVFADTREDEFAMRIQGLSYEAIAQKGGGIRNSVRKLRALTEEQITVRVLKRLEQLIAYGSTTIEAKSGYGLNTEYELLSLRVLSNMKKQIPAEIVSTFLGAHEVPDEYRKNRKDYIQLICDEMIPTITENDLAEFCDVFCEDGVFSVEESRTILNAAKERGLNLTIHSDEFRAIGGTELAAELGAHSANHLMAVTENGISAMRETGVIPVVLPGTSFFLGKTEYAPVRKMWDAGLPVALATDYNPGSSMTPSMQMIANLGCIALKLMPDEVLQATTWNPAKALGRESQKGALIPGFDADFLLWNVNRWEQVPYEFGTNKVFQVYTGGVLIYQNSGEAFFSRFNG